MSYWNINTTPRSTHKQLDAFVIGQESAKRAISTAIQNHFRRCNLNLDEDGKTWLAEPLVEKMNVLLIGPSGSGKTLIISTAARIFNAPFTAIDATKVTPAGWHGKDAEEVCQQLVDAANGDVLKAEMGIVFIDEVCKIMAKSRPDTSEMNGVGVQKAFLKLLEGSKVRVKTKNAEGEAITVDMRTHNVLFVLAGAFDGLAEVIQKRLRNGGPTIGFGADIVEKQADPALLELVQDEDLLAYGFIREFIGRIPLRGALQKLTLQELKLILTTAKHNLIDQYRLLLSPHVEELIVSDEAVEEIALIASKRGTGARALAQVVSAVMAPINYNMGPKRCEISRNDVLVAVGERPAAQAASPPKSRSESRAATSVDASGSNMAARAKSA
jgi:ATP-dependent Clp protease ATP-binding subunit ClpX